MSSSVYNPVPLQSFIILRIIQLILLLIFSVTLLEPPAIAGSSVPAYPPNIPNTLDIYPWQKAAATICFMAMIYVICDLIIEGCYGGFYFLLAHTKYDTPRLFLAMGIIVDLLVATAFAVMAAFAGRPVAGVGLSTDNCTVESAIISHTSNTSDPVNVGTHDICSQYHVIIHVSILLPIIFVLTAVDRYLVKCQRTIYLSKVEASAQGKRHELRSFCGQWSWFTAKIYRRAHQQYFIRTVEKTEP